MRSRSRFGAVTVALALQLDGPWLTVALGIEGLAVIARRPATVAAVVPARRLRLDHRGHPPIYRTCRSTPRRPCSACFAISRLPWAFLAGVLYLAAWRYRAFATRGQSRGRARHAAGGAARQRAAGGRAVGREPTSTGRCAARRRRTPGSPAAWRCRSSGRSAPSAFIARRHVAQLRADTLSGDGALRDHRAEGVPGRSVGAWRDLSHPRLHRRWRRAAGCVVRLSARTAEEATGGRGRTPP